MREGLHLPSLREPASRRGLVIMGGVLLCCVLLFAWAAYTFLPGAADRYDRQIVNDDYAVLTEPLVANGEISQHMQVQGRIYGLILNLTTFERVPHGTLRLRLYSEGGEVVAGSDADMAALLDNTFHRFMFDKPVEGGDGIGYYLSLTATPESEADLVAFYRSEGPARDLAERAPDNPVYQLEDFALFQNKTPVEGTLALQYVTRYAGASVVRAFALFAAVTTLALLLLFSLLFLFRAGVPAVFAVAAGALGLVLVFLVPPASGGQAPYMADAYHYTNVLLGAAGQDSPNALAVRAGDEALFDSPEMNAFLWQNMTAAAAERPADGDMAVLPQPCAGAPAPLYLPQIIGMGLARLLGLNAFYLQLLPRLLNLLAYSIITALALRRLPAARPLLAGVALLPGSLQLAGSLAPAGLPLAAGFYLAAACAGHAQRGTRVGWPQVCGLALCAGLAALYSPVFGLLALVVLMIPVRQYPSVRYAALSMGAVAAVAALCGIWGARTGTTAAAQPGNAQWLKTLLAGTWDGNAVLAGLNWLLPLGLLALVGLLAVPPSRGKALPRRSRAVGAAAAALSIAAAAGLGIVGLWPLGFDGRALLPALLLLAGAGGAALRFRLDVSRPLLFCSTALSVLVQLDAFILILRG